MGRADQQRAELLHRLARDHPHAHPFTLALLLQSRHGIEITGLKAKQLMAAYPPKPHDSHTHDSSKS